MPASDEEESSAAPRSQRTAKARPVGQILLLSALTSVDRRSSRQREMPEEAAVDQAVGPQLTCVAERRASGEVIGAAKRNDGHIVNHCNEALHRAVIQGPVVRKPHSWS
jgi:hypothetical protein